MIAGFLPAACSKKTIAITEVATPPPAIQSEEAFGSQWSPQAMKGEPAAVIEEAAALSREFDAEGAEPRQIELIYQLATNGSAPARRDLDRIYRNAPSLRLKQEVIQALTFVPDEDLRPSLKILGDAVKAGQPLRLRATACDTLRELNNVQTLPLWKTLVQDSDPEIKAGAEQALEYYSIFETE